MKIGIPTAIYSTNVTRTHDNQPVDPPTVPRWFTGFPAKYPVQPVRGEAMFGFFQYEDGTDAVFVANHNAYAPQEMAVRFTRDADYRVEMLDRKSGQWKELEVKDDTVTFELGPGGGELLGVVESSAPERMGLVRTREGGKKEGRRDAAVLADKRLAFRLFHFLRRLARGQARETRIFPSRFSQVCGRRRRGAVSLRPSMLAGPFRH